MSVFVDSEAPLVDVWKRWREADFSWEGLARTGSNGEPVHTWDGWSVISESDCQYAVETATGRRYGETQPFSGTAALVAGGRPATLQDYWRADVATGRILTDPEIEPQLIRQSGQPTYHAAHLPITYEDGTPTPKAHWPSDAMDGLVGPRLELEDTSAHFTGGVWLSAPRLNVFGSHRGSIIYRFSIFIGEVNFTGARFSSFAMFGDAVFTRTANFNECCFESVAIFDSAFFSASVEFNKSLFYNNASFRKSRFEGDSAFKNVQFMADVYFSGTTFNRNISFSGANFVGEARFTDVTFNSGAWFVGAKIRSTIVFKRAQFNSKTSFGHSVWPGGAQARSWHAAFDKATFKDVLDFTGAGFGRFAAFDGAVIGVAIQLDQISETSASNTFREELKAARKIDRGNGAQASERDIELAQLERGCRVLKQAMEKQSDKQREQLFYKFELLARRAQSNLRLGEKTFSFLYGWAADYGASIIRPIIALAIVIAGFAAIFTGWAFVLGAVGGGARQVTLEHASAQSLNFALSNSFKPLSVLSTDAATTGPVIDELLGKNIWVGLCVRLVSILQSLLSVTLAFLFGLSVRRRFQMN